MHNRNDFMVASPRLGNPKVFQTLKNPVKNKLADETVESDEAASDITLPVDLIVPSGGMHSRHRQSVVTETEETARKKAEAQAELERLKKEEKVKTIQQNSLRKVIETFKRTGLVSRQFRGGG